MEKKNSLERERKRERTKKKTEKLKILRKIKEWQQDGRYAYI